MFCKVNLGLRASDGESCESHDAGLQTLGLLGLSNAVALSEPSAFMLVSGAPAPKEQCVVAASDGLAARPRVDAVVTGQGSEIFASGAAGQLHMLDGRCLGIVAEKLSA